MYDLPKTLAELHLEEKVSHLKRENMELRWKLRLQPHDVIVGIDASNPVKLSDISVDLRLAAGAGFDEVPGGIQYFGYVNNPARYEIGVWTDTTTVWNKTGAFYHLDHINRNIQGELLKALEGVR